jgi:hypothetical protein
MSAAFRLPELDNLLSESIDKVLVDLLGDQATRTVYQSLEKQGVQKQQIPAQLSAFDSFLEHNFGRGSKVIATHIAKRLYSMLGWELVEVQNYALADYVGAASQRLVKSQRSE